MREVHVSETGSIGIHDNDVNVDDVWSNKETGETPMPGQTVVGERVMTTMFDSPHDEAGGFVSNNPQIEAQVSRRQDIRPDPTDVEFDKYTLETVEQIKGEAEESQRQKKEADRIALIEQQAKEAGLEFKCREVRIRESITSEYTNVERDDIPEFESNFVENPFEELEQEQIAEINKGSFKVKEHFEDVDGVHISRGEIAIRMARKVLNGEDPVNASFAVRDDIYAKPGVVQPINKVDVWNQYQATIVAEVTQLWHPDRDNQYQVGLLMDSEGNKMKITVWERAGRKRLLHIGDKVKIVRGKVSPFERNGSYEDQIAIDSDAEIVRLEAGDGPAIRNARSTDDPSHADWDVDSDTHSWVTTMMSGDEKEFSGNELEKHVHAYGSGNIVPMKDENGDTYFGVEVESERVVMADGPDMTINQESRSPLQGETMEDFKETLDIGPESKDECPECGSTHISSYQQQTGGADEGMTGFHKCTDCGHNWRSGYGA